MTLDGFTHTLVILVHTHKEFGYFVLNGSMARIYYLLAKRIICCLFDDEVEFFKVVFYHTF